MLINYIGLLTRGSIVLTNKCLHLVDPHSVLQSSLPCAEKRNKLSYFGYIAN